MDFLKSLFSDLENMHPWNRSLELNVPVSFFKFFDMVALNDDVQIQMEGKVYIVFFVESLKWILKLICYRI